jgi:hypothetical protein
VRFGYTQARRLGDVEHMARDLLSLMFEVPEDSFRVAVKPQLGPELDGLVRRARRARARADETARASAEANTVAVTSLLGLGLSMREAGQILGLSHQRVAQIAAGAGKQAADEPYETGTAAEDGRPARRVAER